ATWAVDGFLYREAMGLHLKGQLDRTMYAPRFLPLAERLSRSACNRNCANRKSCILCRLTRYFECFLVEGRIFVTKVHSCSATSGKRVSDDITLRSHPDVAAFQLIRQVTPASV
ncbi:hypothetical protein EV363DRAFT_1167245, partial [Boletus edulis]